jgi:aromatic-amino-acid transaminase
MTAPRTSTLILMNAPPPTSLLAAVELAPKDPILGITESFLADRNRRKINLGVVSTSMTPGKFRCSNA